MDQVDSEIVIVGAGPVGLTLAVFLAREGVAVTVLEKDPGLGDSPRAIVYLHNLLPELDRIGLLDGMIRRGFIDRNGFTLRLPMLDEVINVPLTTLEADGDPYPYNINLGQDQFSQIALEVLRGLPSATVLFDALVTSVVDEGERVQVSYSSGGEDRLISGSWVVGADGGQSIVRKAIDATLEGTTWEERFVATNVRFPFDALGYNTSNLVIHPDYGCVVARITPDGLWRCTYQESDELPEETVPERIESHFVKLLGEEDAARVEVVAFRPYRMHQRLASRLRSGRIVLAGDAAHLTNPTGGLGLTTGLFDVYLLQEVLLAVLRGADADAALEYYAEDRARVFSQVSSPNASMLKRLVYATPTVAEQNSAVAPQRAAAESPEIQRQFLSGVDLVRSPSWASRS